MHKPNAFTLFLFALLLSLSTLAAVSAAAPTQSSITPHPTASTAVVSWTTNAVSYRNTVFYGVTSAMGLVATTAVNSTGPNVTIPGVYSTTVYYYRVQSCDNAGACTNSSVSTFTTGCTGNGAVSCDAFEGLPSTGSNISGFLTGIIGGVLQVIFGLAMVAFIVALVMSAVYVIKKAVK